MTTTATDIGQKELPAGWKWVKLGDVCIKTSTVDPKLEPDKTFTYIDISSVDRDTKTIVNPQSVLGQDAPSRAKRLVLNKDVLVSTTRPNLNAVAIVPPSLDGEVCSTGFCVLRSDKTINPDYLFNFTKSRQFVEPLSGLVSGALYPAVTDKQVLSQPIPLPPLGEQKRIAGILNEQMAAVEEAKKAAQERLEAAQALPAAYLREALEGHESKDWGTVPLGNLFHLKHGYAFKGEYFSDHGIYQVLTPGHFLANGGLNEKRDSPIYYSGDFPDEFLLQTNDLLVVMTDLKWDAPILGSAGFIPEDNRFLHNQRLGKLINWDKSLLHPKFVYHLFNAEYVRRQIKASATGSTVRHTSPKRIYEVKVYFPSVHVQKRIASELDDKIAGVKLAEASLQQELDTIGAMPAALLRKAFSGGL